ncbi:hypothetical protein [Pseudoalteromonas phenolica]|uniref:Uncharacterized protein n=1 Tax=Pseudoalteromonas phenolica TaxID=161398 RepID=A0A0S2K8M3_9GAMM|nr:hypothetical protein [Pseudoalteromonas phenolica]ALO44371.1 hypothetical protein PP2015_3902 [Pseudoalteromonas phenolica]MBE0357381.1 hypothetical protein [Pseudoalteromonas phenolica O-BC30]
MKLSLKKKNLKTLKQPLANKQLGAAATPQIGGGAKPIDDDTFTHPFICTSFVGFTC